MQAHVLPLLRLVSHDPWALSPCHPGWQTHVKCDAVLKTHLVDKAC
jgi:hypothetical protein